MAHIEDNKLIEVKADKSYPPGTPQAMIAQIEGRQVLGDSMERLKGLEGHKFEHRSKAGIVKLKHIHLKEE